MVKFVNNHVKQTIVSSLIVTIILYQILPINGQLKWHRQLQLADSLQNDTTSNSLTEPHTHNGEDVNAVISKRYPEFADVAMKFLESIVPYLRIKPESENYLEMKHLIKEIFSSLIGPSIRGDHLIASIKLILMFANFLAKDDHIYTMNNFEKINQKVIETYHICALWRRMVLYDRKNAILENFAVNYTKYFDRILDQIILCAIADKKTLIGHFDNIMKFIHELPSLHQKAIALKTLFFELKKYDLLKDTNEEIIKFGQELKTNIESADFGKLDERYKLMLTQVNSDMPLWTRKPTSAKEIITHGMAMENNQNMATGTNLNTATETKDLLCSLKNRKYGDFLATSVGNQFWDEKRHHFYNHLFAIPLDYMQPDIVPHWKFEMINNMKVFAIKSFSDEYMFSMEWAPPSPTNSFDKYYAFAAKMIPVGDNLKVENAHWQTKPTDGKFVTITNRFKQLNLFADEQINGTRRQVFIANVTGPAAEWEWNCFVEISA